MVLLFLVVYTQYINHLHRTNVYEERLQVCMLHTARARIDQIYSKIGVSVCVGVCEGRDRERERERQRHPLDERLVMQAV